MWDLQKTLEHARGVIRRKEQGKPPFHCSPEENAYFGERRRLAEEGRSAKEIDAVTIPLRDAAYPLGDWPGRRSVDS